jgi:hypothetical protein
MTKKKNVGHRLLSAVTTALLASVVGLHIGAAGVIGAVSKVRVIVFFDVDPVGAVSLVVAAPWCVHRGSRTVVVRPAPVDTLSFVLG